MMRCVAVYALAFPVGYCVALAAGAPVIEPSHEQEMVNGATLLLPPPASPPPMQGGPAWYWPMLQGIVGGVAAGTLACVASVDMVTLGRAHEGAWRLKGPKLGAAFVGAALMSVLAIFD